MNRLLRVSVLIGAVSIFTLSSRGFAAAKQQPGGAATGSGSALPNAYEAQGQTGVSRWLGIDCTTTDTCYAVGYQFLGGVNGGQGVVVQIQDGVVGSPRGVSGVEDLTRIACVNADTCYAVGFASGGVMVPLINGQAGAPVPLGTWEIEGGLGCAPDGTTCYIVGSSAPVRGGTGVVVPIASGQVGQQLTLPNVEGLGDVACPTNGICYAVGSRSSADGDEAVIVPLTGGGAGTPDAVNGLGYLDSIVCPSSDVCYAAGGDATGDTAVVTLTDGAITGSELLSPPIHDGVLGCADTDACFLIGSGGTGSGTSTPVVLTLTDGAPANSQMVPAGGELHDVACVTSSTCIAVGEDDSAAGSASAVGLMLTITDGVVGEPQLIPYSGS